MMRPHAEKCFARHRFFNPASTRGEPIDGVERDHDRGRDHRVFQDDVIDPMALERQIVAFHCNLSDPEAASGLTMVVLASHSPPRATVLRVFATKPRRSKKPRAL